jgi:hypothetical protein
VLARARPAAPPQVASEATKQRAESNDETSSPVHRRLHTQPASAQLSRFGCGASACPKPAIWYSSYATICARACKRTRKSSTGVPSILSRLFRCRARARSSDTIEALSMQVRARNQQKGSRASQEYTEAVRSPQICATRTDDAVLRTAAHPDCVYAGSGDAVPSVLRGSRPDRKGASTMSLRVRFNS